MCPAPSLSYSHSLWVSVLGNLEQSSRSMSSFVEAQREEGNSSLDLQTLNFPPMDHSHSLQQFMDTHSHATTTTPTAASTTSSAAAGSSRYENQKRRDWNTFGQYLRNHRPPLSLSRCSGAHVLEFLRYLDQFGKTKVHAAMCPFYGHPNPPAPCPCPVRQAWGSLDALIGRLRAAFEENGGKAEANPFGARAVRLYLREVRDLQSKARGISYEKKKRKRLPPHQQPSTATHPH